MNKVENDVNAILTADSYIKAFNVIDFISRNKGTDKQVCFQGDGQGRFYVGVGEFELFLDPQIKDTGALIYDMSGEGDQISELEKYKCAIHLGNLMNFILVETKGIEYCSRRLLLVNMPMKLPLAYSKKIKRGVYDANSYGDFFYCFGQGHAGYYRDPSVYSNRTFAIWW